jgi:hypothetical protein
MAVCARWTALTILAVATGASIPATASVLLIQETHGNEQPDQPARTPNSTRTGPELNTLDEMYAALRRCYVPPRLELAHPGMRMTVQFAFTRDGDLMGKPRILYESPGASPEQQSAYRAAVAAALVRCSPLPFSKSLGKAVAGRVFAIQFVDERNLRGA